MLALYNNNNNANDLEYTTPRSVHKCSAKLYDLCDKFENTTPGDKFKV